MAIQFITKDGHKHKGGADVASQAAADFLPKYIFRPSIYVAGITFPVNLGLILLKAAIHYLLYTHNINTINIIF